MTLATAGLRAGIAALNGVGSGLSAIGIDSPRLDADSLRRSAIARTGHSHFGEWSIEEPMERLLRSYHDDARLTTLGRITVRETLVSQLENLLRMEHARALDPQIARRQIKAPVFITGLPRTGTTLLHGLMTEDPNNRVPLTSEVMYPAGLPDTDDAAIRRRTNARLAWVSRLAPGFERIHPLDADLPQECIAITALAFRSIQFHTTHDVPSYEDWFEANTQATGYAFHRRLLQHLQARRAGARWVLKAPGHLFALAELLAEYPDAKIVQTHRDPLRVVASMASLATVLKRAFSHAADARQIGRDWAQRWAGALDRFLQVRDRSASNQFLDVAYEDLVTDPISTVESVYAFIGEVLSDDARERMHEFLRRHPQNKHGRHRYSLSEFGLDAAEQAARFSSYCDRFSIRMQAI